MRVNERGQSVIEFMFAVILFLGIVFAVMTFAMMMILNEMTFYSTFMAARTVSVGGAGAQTAAAEILPGIVVNTAGGTPEQVMMHGRYDMRDFLTRGGGALTSPFANFLQLETNMAMYRWPTCAPGGDNGLNNCP